MSLKEIDVSNFDTEIVKNFSEMFYNCTSLKSLNIKNFNLHSKKVSRMFWGCSETLQENIKNQFGYIDEKVVFQN